MNPRLGSLHTYPFEKLARLLAGAVAPAHLPHIALSIGEPQHEPPRFVLDALRQGVDRLGAYPATAGTLELRSSASRWLERRFGLRPGSVDPATMVLPVNGTREALFALVQAAVDTSTAPLVITPNPFYQIYEGAALLAGATPYYLNATAGNHFAPELDQVPKAVLDRTQVLFLCSPGNPTGTVLSRSYLARALDLAERHDFIVAADECYAEIFADEAAPPPSLLEVAQETGRDRFQRCIVFHSLSKRSSVPGLRSGFVAGDPELMRRFLLYRTYQGGAMSPMVQLASVAAWDDDAHVRANRRLYREKFERVLPILSPVLDVQRPDGAFYLWVDVGGDDERFTRELQISQNVTVLPGSYLGRATEQGNPGQGRVRLSLTATVEDCEAAATRIREFMKDR
ncbi:MAG TPA: succinyldiaminopimelate transaminase [Steroidobacteraceae bacterium]|nr:succinyldiaminopimelate transaminase [Steroidobacteraceae bacterium]